ncbi:MULTISPECIES: hypothetical protein [Cryobacterium]|uniref:DUF8094 domain-containing protein n=1 Tax=Cryobacterium zongtaii TaxID=1259217 RepID=A0A2S3ZJ39_9MICO|nr:MULTISPECIES: hypothetical protein [Cryobacterium]POH65694.1 hypothetical protein C3B60_12545 [Cryobacterium zongtaii]POH67609.1 hypothetical protein C3B61_06855 [Cryobacterium zongtaii]TFC45393.1 hypothetical protein E3O57_09880 [Cryobacterium sp. TMN-39-2]
MRFVFAILAFVLAALMIAFGIAQRTVFLEPASTSLSATVDDGAPYAVIDGAALGAFPGSQTITVSGSDSVFVAYARTADIQAWIGADEYAAVGLDADTGKLTVTPATGTAVTPAAETEAAPLATDPAGSDLWLEEYTGDRSLTTTISAPEGISVLVASDGTAPAPTDITVAWPTDNATPWAGPLIVGGALIGLLGFVIYLLGLLHFRRSRRPRRNVPRGPRMPRLPRVPRPKTIKASEITGPRRSIGRSMIAVPLVLVSGLVLSGCSPEFWPTAAPEAAATATATPSPSAEDTEAPVADEAPEPAVTVPQLERIVGDIVALTAEADANLDADSLATRFTGPALEQRLANYKVRAADASYAATVALPDSPLTLTLPQQTDAWPRVVMTVLQSADEASVPTMALILKQESPRENYLVEYAVQLEASAKVPSVAPATIGAPLIAPDNKFMSMAPNAVGPAYADILLKGEASPSFPLFEAKGDTARTQLGLEYKEKQLLELEDTGTMEFTNAVGSGEIIALATNDSGSIVAVSVNEITTVTPVAGKATITPKEGPSKALSGIEETTKGIQSTYSEQLLFHVPAANSTDKIVLLGFSQGLINSVELP